MNARRKRPRYSRFSAGEKVRITRYDTDYYSRKISGYEFAEVVEVMEKMLLVKLATGEVVRRRIDNIEKIEAPSGQEA